MEEDRVREGEGEGGEGGGTEGAFEERFGEKFALQRETGVIVGAA